jgi:hypothetical protein
VPCSPHYTISVKATRGQTSRIPNTSHCLLSTRTRIPSSGALPVLSLGCRLSRRNARRATRNPFAEVRCVASEQSHSRGTPLTAGTDHMSEKSPVSDFCRHPVQRWRSGRSLPASPPTVIWGKPVAPRAHSRSGDGAARLPSYHGHFGKRSIRRSLPIPGWQPSPLTRSRRSLSRVDPPPRPNTPKTRPSQNPFTNFPPKFSPSFQPFPDFQAC